MQSTQLVDNNNNSNHINKYKIIKLMIILRVQVRLIIIWIHHLNQFSNRERQLWDILMRNRLLSMNSLKKTNKLHRLVHIDLVLKEIKKILLYLINIIQLMRSQSNNIIQAMVIIHHSINSNNNNNNHHHNNLNSINKTHLSS